MQDFHQFSLLRRSIESGIHEVFSVFLASDPLPEINVNDPGIDSGEPLTDPATERLGCPAETPNTNQSLLR